MRYFLVVLILILGTSCSEEELQQQRMDREVEMAVRVQEYMFFFQEKESQLCFAVIAGQVPGTSQGFGISYVPCESVKHLLVRSD